MSDRDDIEQGLRASRVGGRRPTARDRWKSLYRLWRLTKKGDMFQTEAAGECFMVLFGSWPLVRLLKDSDGDGLVDNGRLPLLIRKLRLRSAINKRLRGHSAKIFERDMAVARKVREQFGIETTPDEVAEIRYKVLQLAKKAADAAGVRPPSSFEELVQTYDIGRIGDNDG